MNKNTKDRFVKLFEDFVFEDSAAYAPQQVYNTMSKDDEYKGSPYDAKGIDDYYKENKTGPPKVDNEESLLMKSFLSTLKNIIKREDKIKFVQFVSENFLGSGNLAFKADLIDRLNDDEQAQYREWIELLKSK